jgi:CelD/BcsL family acetyltransferase involved in cellulose biosynthesis
MKLLRLPITSPECAELFASEAEGTMAWFRALANQTLEKGEEPFLATLAGSRGAVAAIALVCRPDGTIRGLTAPYTTRFGPAALSSCDAYALGLAMKQLIPARLDVDAVHDTPVNRAFLDGMEESGLITASYRHFANWFEEIANFEDYWSRRPKRLRETVRRQSRRMAKAGAKIDILHTPADLEAGAALYGNIYSQSGKCSEPHAGFIDEMIRNLSLTGDVHLGLLWLGGQPVAAQIWLVRERQATIFKLAHRLAYSAFSPGTVLTHEMFSQLVPGLGLKRMDFGRGDDMYKRDWLQSRTFRRGMVACNPSSLRGLRGMVTSVFPTRAAAAARRLFPSPPAPESCTSTGASSPTSPGTASIMSN